MANKKPTDPLDRLVEAGLLLDTYGALLTERQRRFMGLHFEEDRSFSEIAREFRISRQAVHDSVKHAASALERFERALGVVKKSRAGGSGGPIGDQWLIERLQELRSRVQEREPSAGIDWIIDEISEMVDALGERHAGPRASEAPRPAAGSPR
jgi:hypothetical protein